MHRLRIWLASVAILVCVTASKGDTDTNANDELWFYAPVNLQVDEDTDRLIGLIHRAAKAGYNGATVTDFKFGKLTDRPDHYFHNMKRVRQAAESVGIKLIPCVMPYGYSNSVLQNNPNLAASVPVRGARFVVQNGLATLPRVEILVGGDFENAGSSGPKHWSWIDGWNQSTSLDSEQKHDGKSSLKMTDFKSGSEVGNARVAKNIELNPFRQYQFSVWAKTDNLDVDEIKLEVIADGRRLNFAYLQVQPDQDWTRHTVVFNSLEESAATLYLGVWNGRSGTVWLDDASLAEVGGVNLVRPLPTAAIVGHRRSGRQLIEGRDFEQWSDPQLGVVPYAGEFSDDHDAPPIRILNQDFVDDGDELLVSFDHTLIVHDDQVACSLTSREFDYLARDQVKALSDHWKTDHLFMQHDEIRVAGYETDYASPSTFDLGADAGVLLAKNISRISNSLWLYHDSPELYVWSDMFDPNHNAVDNYYLTRNTMAGSWEGLPNKVVVVNWNQNKPRESLRWFAGQGHDQIVSAFYDEDVDANFQTWSEAATGVRGIRGWMYTTWEKNYDDLERFAQLVQE